MEKKRLPADAMRVHILDAAEALLRRHGPDKLAVTDVAAAMGMTHGNVYRHFSTKAQLRAAVVEKWLERIQTQMAQVADAETPADRRLSDWLTGLARIKQRKVVDDVEMLAASRMIGAEMVEVEQRHSAALRAQVERILADGLNDGTLPNADPVADRAAAIMNAASRFFHPDFVRRGGPADQQMAALSGVVDLILQGLARRA
jgi:AcrR family transcriptional regulator